MNAPEKIMERLRTLKPELAVCHKVKEIGLFGSFIRGEQRETSDIDLLVDFEEGADLLDLVGLAQCLKQRLHRKVDLVTRNALREELRETVLKEVASP